MQKKRTGEKNTGDVAGEFCIFDKTQVHGFNPPYVPLSVWLYEQSNTCHKAKPKLNMWRGLIVREMIVC